MERALKLLNRIDWVLAAGCLTYGAVTVDWRWAAAGVLSLCTAWLNPSARLKAWLEKKMLSSPKRRKEAAARASAVRIEQEEAAYAATTASAAPAAPLDFSVRLTGYGQTYLNPSKHNQLRPGAYNLHGARTRTWF